MSRTGRPQRRLAGAVLGVVLGAGVLSAGTGPAQAAAADVETERLRGATRYETAVEIAEAYVDDVEGSSFGDEVDTVILTSGLDEHFGYVLPAPALSRSHHAPVLLTEPDELPRAARRFIEDHDISDVIVLGGTDVVSQAVEDEIAGMPGVSAERIAGGDVYDTAVEVAEQVGPAARLPGPFRRAVLLATGEAFADALAAGPLAYVGQHPILLTPTAALPHEVVGYLEDNNIDHVVILGGTVAVSVDVEFDIEDLGIDVTRWRGITRYETAIEISKALLADDSPQECFDGSEVGLAYAWKSPDAIVSGPYLGELCAPLLLADRYVLPRSVRDVLEADGLFVGGPRGGLRITAFGGSAAISEAVLRSAANAAELEALSARVTATAGACFFTVVFDEPVLTIDADDPRNYLIDGLLLDLASADVEAGFGDSTTEVTVTFDNASTATDAAVPTGCGTPLRARDVVGVAAKRIRSAVDNRTVSRVEFRVPDDGTRPRLTIVAGQASTVVEINTSEPVTGAEGAATIDVKFHRSGLEPIVVEADVTPGGTRIEASVPNELDTATTVGLFPRDQVIVDAGELQDLAGNGNLRTAKTVVGDSTPPRASRISVSSAAPSQRASVSFAGEDSNAARVAAALRIVTKQGSSVDGAAGNTWLAEVDVLSQRPTSWPATRNASVSLNHASDVMLITTVEDATLGAVRDELNATSLFATYFVAEVAAGLESLVPLDSVGQVRLGGGASTVDITVVWSEAVRGCDAATDAVRPELIEIDIDRDGHSDLALDGLVLDNSRDLIFVGDTSGRTSIIAGTATCATTTPSFRSGTLVARLQSPDIDDLPTSRSSALVRAGAAHDLSGNPSILLTRLILRPA